MKAKLRKVQVVLISVMAVLLVLAIALPVAANIPALKSIAYTYVGRGEARPVQLEGTESWDTNYYDPQFDNKEAAVENGEIAQKTEDLVGPYELHDCFLYHILRPGERPKKIYRLALIAFDGVYDRETVKHWLTVFIRRFFSQQFKRSCLPDGPKVGSVTLSPRGDWRMPSDASSADWISEVESL